MGSSEQMRTNANPYGQCAAKTERTFDRQNGDNQAFTASDVAYAEPDTWLIIAILLMPSSHFLGRSFLTLPTRCGIVNLSVRPPSGGVVYS